MRVLGLCSYPVEAAATRFRLQQFVGPLAERGIELTVSPFLDGVRYRDLYKGGVAAKAFGMLPPVGGRLGELRQIGKYDLIFVQREAMFFGPAVFEWLFQKLGRIPMVLDLDDATYVRYVSPSFGRVGSLLKFFGKTDRLIKRSAAVVCGNRFISEYVEAMGKRAVVIPTVVDTEKFRPRERRLKGNTLNVGWIGTHSTFPSLKSLFPVLERLAAKHQFELTIVGAGRDHIVLNGVHVRNLEWSLEREVEDFQSLDIGLYPIVASDSADERWLRGKSGFKAIEYMAVGVPFVMSPVGVCAEIGEPGRTHFNAETAEDWYNSLDKLLSDSALRQQMGRRARGHSLEKYGISMQIGKLAGVFTDVVQRPQVSGKQAVKQSD